jgi:phosphonate metabolism protein PhnN/1,5-bisphosphokinase (PRPP-forming)
VAGQVFAVVGPSGAGKDTLLAGAVQRRPDLFLVRRVITRPETAGGEPFEGVTPEEFARRRAAGAFVLDWEAHGLSYGIPVAAQDAREAGRDVIFNGSRAVLGRAREVFPGLIVLYVTAAPAVLAARLAARGRESAAQIEARLARAGEAVPEGGTVRVVRNESTPEEGVAALLAALQPVSA